VNANCVPKNASGWLKPPVLRLQKRIILRWSVVGYRWPTAANFQNGYRTSPRPSASANIRNNEPLRRNARAQEREHAAQADRHIDGVEDYQVALVTYRAACQRWPGIPITLRQGARVIDDSRRTALGLG
jgi:hypothetical protein